MESRMDKYYTDEVQGSRSKKNTNLYKEVYGSYSELEYLPVSENVSEIDEEKLKEIVTSREEYQKQRNIPVEEIPKKEERKIYDINELLEKARNSKPKVVETKKVVSQSYNYLKTLESKELLKSEIKEELIKQEKIKEPTEFETKSGNTLSLEILSELKPTSDTVVMEPISSNNRNTNNDIPIEITKKDEDEKAFYSGSYKFSKSDFFEDDDDFYENKKGSSIAKAFVLVIVIAICITGIYFLINYLGTR